MLLNKLPVLDNGYIALLDSHFNSQLVARVRDEFMGADPVRDVELWKKFGRLTLVIRCPIFVMCGFTKYDFTVMSTVEEELQAYVPHPGEIGSGDHSTDVEISSDLGRTTQALLINPKAYQADGCDRFISQLITPVNTYTTLIVSASYKEWLEYCDAANTPVSIAAYQRTIKQIVDNEWKNNGEET